MFDSEEHRRRLELLVTILAKLYLVVELSAEACPLCHHEPGHDADCPAALAWSLFDENQRIEARRAIQALAFQLGYDDPCNDSLVH